MNSDNKSDIEVTMNKSNIKRYLSYACIIISGLLWSTMGVFTKKFSSAGFSAIEIVGIRSYFSAVILLIYNLIKRRGNIKLKSIGDIKYFIGTGIISVVFFSWAYMKSIMLSSVSVAATLLYTAPAIVMILSIFLFKDKPTLKKIIVVIITFIGCLCVTGLLENSNSVSTSGIFFGLCAGFGYAMYSIFSTYALRKYDSTEITFYTFLVAAICLFPFLSQVLRKIYDNGMIPLAIIFSFIVTIVPYTLYTYGLTNVDAGKASLMATVEPVGAALIGIFVYNESATIMKIVGILLVAVSVIFSSKK